MLTRSFVSSVLLILFCALVQAQPPEKKPSATAEDVEKVYRAYLDASVKKDEKALVKMIADDYTLTDSSGKLYNRADLLGIILEPTLKQEASPVTNLKVREYGDTAIITARCVEKGTAKGVKFENPMQCTLTFVKKDKEWLIVAEHVSRLKE
jgi:ketosteroid isomerase-like protein